MVIDSTSLGKGEQEWVVWVCLTCQTFCNLALFQTLFWTRLPRFLHTHCGASCVQKRKIKDKRYAEALVIDPPKPKGSHLSTVRVLHWKVGNKAQQKNVQSFLSVYSRVLGTKLYLGTAEGPLRNVRKVQSWLWILFDDLYSFVRIRFVRFRMRAHLNILSHTLTWFVPGNGIEQSWYT